MSIFIMVPITDLPNITCSDYDPVYSALANIGTSGNYNQTVRSQIGSVECLSNRMVWG